MELKMDIILIGDMSGGITPPTCPLVLQPKTHLWGSLFDILYVYTIGP